MIERILNLMSKHKITATALSKHLGLSTSAVTDWKKGKAKPTTTQIIAMSELFNVTTDYILKGIYTGEESQQSINDSFNNSPHSTITIHNGTTHTRELTEIESELIKVSSELVTKNKIELLKQAYKLKDENNN